MIGLISFTFVAEAGTRYSRAPYKRERMRQLFNRHGYNLAVFNGGHVKGRGKQSNKCMGNGFPFK